MAPPLLGYWDNGSLAEPIRFALHHAQVDFQDKKYSSGPDKGVWYEQDMPKLDLDFPNLPYYIDGDLKLTQSLAILRYVARKYGLAGKPGDEVLVEMAEQQAIEYVTKSFPGSKAKRLEVLPAQLDAFTKYLGDKKFVVGNDVTYADFLWYENLQYHRVFEPSQFENRDVIDAYVKRIEQLPNIAKYMASPAYNRQGFSSWSDLPE